MIYTRLRVRAVPRPRLHPDPPRPEPRRATLNYELSVNNNVVDAQSSSEAPGLAMATAARKAQMSPSAPRELHLLVDDGRLKHRGPSALRRRIANAEPENKSRPGVTAAARHPTAPRWANPRRSTRETRTDPAHHERGNGRDGTRGDDVLAGDAARDESDEHRRGEIARGEEERVDRGLADAGLGLGGASMTLGAASVAVSDSSEARTRTARRLPWLDGVPMQVAVRARPAIAGRALTARALRAPATAARSPR